MIDRIPPGEDTESQEIAGDTAGFNGEIEKLTKKIPALDADGEVVGVVRTLHDVTDSKTVKELRRSEARYRAVVEDQTELICRSLPDTTLTFVNQAYCRYFGKSREELVGRSFLGLVPEEDRKRIKEHFASLDQQNPVATIEHSATDAEGEVRWQQWTNHAICDEGGRVVEIQSVGRDVTEIRDLLTRAESMLSQQDCLQHNWKHLLNNVPAGAILLDSGLRIVAANKAYAELFEPAPQFREGARIEEALPHAEECGIMEALRHALRSDRPVRVENFRYDGLSTGVTYWNASAVPVRMLGRRGPERGLAVFVVDATAENWARQRLSEMAALAEQRAVELEAERVRLRAIIDSAPVPLVVCDVGLKITAFNSAADAVCTATGMRSWLDNTCATGSWGDSELFHPDGKLIDPRDYPQARSIRGEVCQDVVISGRGPAGLQFVLKINSAPLRDAEGRIMGAVVAFSDVTEETRARGEIQEVYRREHAIAEKLQRSFLPHDFPGIEGFQLAQRYLPALDEALVGGDFYDIFRLGDGKYGIVMADVSGKGLKAAVYTAMTKHMLRAYAFEERDPKLVLARLNDALVACTPYEVFVTLVYGVMESDTRRFTYANAGHEQPLYFYSNPGFATTLDVTGGALGLIGGAHYGSHSIEMACGDILMLYTDGITDAGQGGLRLGQESVVRLLESSAYVPLSDLADSTLSLALDFSGKKLADDAAVLLLRALEE